MIKRLARERGELKDSFGAWSMNEGEEERIFSGLRKQWNKATVVTRNKADYSKVPGLSIDEW